jgi:hypothetical protein
MVTDRSACPTRATWLTRLRARVAAEHGIALVLALLIVSALSISTAGIALLVTSNEHAFGRDRQETLAFNTGEAGLNYAIATLAKTFDPNGNAVIGTTVPATSYGASSGVGGTGDGQWWAVKSSAHIWKVFAIGTSPNGKVTREVSVQVKSKTVPGTIVPASLAWQYGLFVAAPTSCFSPQGTVDLTISVYVNGDMCLGGSAGIAEPSGSLGGTIKVYAKGRIDLQSGSAHIGSSANPTGYVANVTALSGCFPAKGVQCSNIPNSKVWAKSYTPAGSPITKPTVDPDGTYASGDWKNPVCSVGSFTFDNDTTRNTSVSGANLFPASNYDCSVHATGDPSTQIGRLAWNAATKVLTITDVIYIDGDLSIGSNTQVRYSAGSFGSLYIDGIVTTNGGSSLCGPPAVPAGSVCSTKWDGNLGSLFMVAVNHQNGTTGWKMNGNAEFDIGLYVVGLYNNGGGAFVTGPVVTDQASVGGSSSSADVTNPPPGTPGSTTTAAGATSWAVLSTTWRQCPVVAGCN